MNIKEITDRKGRTFKWDESAGHGWFVEFSRNYLKDSWKQTLEEVKALELRDDDVMICTFPKSGNITEPRHEISNNVVCVTSKALDQPAHMRSLIRAFASRLNILCM